MIISLLSSQNSLTASAKASQVWLGDGLGSLTKRMMFKLELMVMQDFRPRSSPQMLQEGATQTLVALPGFELAQPRKKPIDSIITWVQCFSRYTAAMAHQHYPECTPGITLHMLTAHYEAEFPGWRQYDHAFRDKMASTGMSDLTKWMSTSTRSTVAPVPSRGMSSSYAQRMESCGKPSVSDRPKWVCRDYNGAGCSHPHCKFPH